MDNGMDNFGEGDENVESDDDEVNRKKKRELSMSGLRVYAQPSDGSQEKEYIESEAEGASPARCCALH